MAVVTNPFYDIKKNKSFLKFVLPLKFTIFWWMLIYNASSENHFRKRIYICQNTVRSKIYLVPIYSKLFTHFEQSSASQIFIILIFYSLFDRLILTELNLKYLICQNYKYVSSLNTILRMIRFIAKYKEIYR